MMYKVNIATNQKEIDTIINLRYAILRKPWHKPKHTVTDNLEHESINVFINDNGKCVACGRLQKNDLNVGQIRFMAVDDLYQGRGLGKLIVSKLEQEAINLGLKIIELQARENAIEFYKSQNYEVVESSFILWDIIPHFLMRKFISVS